MSRMTELSDAEIRLAGMGLHLAEDRKRFKGQPARRGCFLALEAAGTSSVGFTIAVRPNLSPRERQLVAEWVEQRIQRFAEHGPEPDAWTDRGDGGWQLWGSLVELPEEIVAM